MKRIKIITAAISLCMAATLFAGCNNASDESAAVSRIDGGQTKINVDNGGGDNSSAGDYTFFYKGYEIALGEKLGKYLDILGEPNDKLEGDSCNHDGMDLEYYYPGFVIRCIKENEDVPDEEAFIKQIDIDDAIIDCNGIRVGQKISDAKAVFGTPDQEDEFAIIYRSGNIVFTILNNEVGEIIGIRFEYTFN